MLGTSKSIWGFDPRSVPGCTLWLDASDTATMNTTPTVTIWKDKSGQSNDVTGTATATGSTMTFNGTNQAFSNLTFVFPSSNYSMFAVYSNTTAPASTAYMNAVYGTVGYPMLGVYDVNKYVSARSVVANTGALGAAVGWAAQISSSSIDIGRAIATDSSGNVFVTGQYSAALTLYNQGPLGTAGTTLPYTGGTDVFVAKYSSAGAVLWAAQITGTNTSGDTGFGIATDPSGNVLVTGQYSAALTVYNQGPSGTFGASLPFTGFDTNASVFIAKYSSAGAVLWATRIAAFGSNVGYGIATDSSGNVLVTADYNQSLTMYNQGETVGTTLPAPSSGTGVFVAKYSSAGSVVWAARIYTGSFFNNTGAIATDTSGNVLVTGQYNGAALTLYNQGPSGTAGTTLTWTVNADCSIAKYSSAGDVIWAARIAGAGNDIGQGIATDSSGNVLVTGSYTAALTVYNQGPSGTAGTTLPYIGGADVFVAKYSSAGAVVWAARITGTTTNSEVGYAIATDSSGNVFVTGSSVGALTVYNQGPSGTAGATLPSGGAFVAKYSSAGAVLWAARIVGAGSETGYGIATDSSGNVLVTGSYGAALTQYTAGGTVGTTLPYTGSGSEIFVAKYSPDGYMAPAIPASSNVLVGATYTPSTMSPFVNGRTYTTLAGATLATTGIYVGGPSNYFNGTISEVLIYSNTLSPLQRQAVEGYLAYKWRIQSNLPTTQPFYAITPFSRTFTPVDLLGCSLWLDGGDNSTMNSTPTVTSWSDKSGNSNTMTGTGTWSGSNMVFNGTTNAFSNTAYVFPNSAYSLFAVYSNTTAPASTAYMNVMYGSNGYPMLGVYDVNKYVSARSVVANTGALNTVPVGWAARIAGTGSDIGQGIATDSSGNVFVTGQYSAALTVYNQGPSGTAGTTLPYIVGADVFVAKYSSAGAVVWAARIAGAGTDIGQGIATDSSGNVLVTGSYAAALTLYNQGPSGTAGTTLPLTTADDVFVAKYSSAGAVVWAARIAGTTTGGDNGYGIATDSSGNVFVTGYYSAALTVYNQGPSGTAGTTLPPTGAFVAKYSSAGAVLWAARISSVLGYGIATDSSGNVFVTGYYSAALTVYNQGPSGTAGTTLPFTGGNDVFVAKYSSAGDVVWAARIAGTTTSIEQGNAIATDSSGNVFVTGYYSAALTVYNQGPSGTAGTTLPFTGGNDVFVAKYSSAGDVVWAARIAGTTTSIDRGQAIATDSSGNVLVTGRYGAALTLYNQGPSGTAGTTLPFAGGNDVFVAKYSSAGDVVWAAQIGSASTDTGFGIATDSSGNVFVTGSYSAALTLYNTGGTAGTTLPPTGGDDVFVAKYTPEGYITVPAAANSNVLVDATYTSSTFSPFVNGFTANTLAGATLAATGIYVGGPSNYFNGSLSELIIYASTLTSVRRQQVEGYLAAKWGLRSSLISNQPYKIIPPTTLTPVTPGSVGTVILTSLSQSGGTIVWGAESTLADGYIWYVGTGPGSGVVASGFISSPTTYSATFTGTFLANSGYYGWVTPYTVAGPGALTISDLRPIVVISNAGGTDAYVASYNSNGLPRWASRVASTVTDDGMDVATDTSGNVYVLSQYGAAATLFDITGTSNKSLAFLSGNSVVVKYSSAGAIIWAVTMQGYGSGLTVDTSGNVIVGGITATSPNVFYDSNGTSNASLTGVSAFTAKYTSTGTVSWVAGMGAGAGASISRCCVKTDASGNAIVLGHYVATTTIYNGAATSNGTSFGTITFSGTTGYSDSFIVKYSPTGSVSWTTRIVGVGAPNNPPIAGGIAVDSTGTIYAHAASIFSNGPGIYNANGTLYGRSTGTGSFIVKYTSAGAVSAVLSLNTNATGGLGVPRRLAVDASDNIYATGWWQGNLGLTLVGTSGANITIPFGTLSNAFVASFTSAGVPRWGAAIAGMTSSRGSGIAIDSNQNVFMAGSSVFAGAFTQYNSTGIAVNTVTGNNTTSSGFLAKYSSTGNAISLKLLGGTTSNVGNSCAASGGNVYMTGYESSTTTLL